MRLAIARSELLVSGRSVDDGLDQGAAVLALAGHVGLESLGRVAEGVAANGASEASVGGRTGGRRGESVKESEKGEM